MKSHERIDNRYLKIIASNLKDARLENSIEISTVAEECNTTEETIREFEAGNVNNLKLFLMINDCIYGSRHMILATQPAVTEYKNAAEAIADIDKRRAQEDREDNV